MVIREAEQFPMPKLLTRPTAGNTRLVLSLAVRIGRERMSAASRSSVYDGFRESRDPSEPN
jgi:hypothetical protein